tara:strand:+ start:759 stop:1286 length:528 start_codon:yes stop_codon:yes gene_type:complete
MAKKILILDNDFKGFSRDSSWKNYHDKMKGNTLNEVSISDSDYEAYLLGQKFIESISNNSVVFGDAIPITYSDGSIEYRLVKTEIEKYKNILIKCYDFFLNTPIGEEFGVTSDMHDEVTASKNAINNIDLESISYFTGTTDELGYNIGDKYVVSNVNAYSILKGLNSSIISDIEL